MIRHRTIHFRYMIALIAAATLFPTIRAYSGERPAVTVTAAYPVANSASGGETATPSDSLHDGAGLEAFQTFAEARNPGLRAARERESAARAIIPRERALPDPRLGYTFEDMRANGGTYRHRVDISREFPWFGKRGLMGDRAEVEAYIAGAGYRTERFRLRRMVAEALAEYIYLLRSADVAEEGLTYLKSVEHSVRARYTTGGEPQSALIKARLELGKREEELASIRDLLVPAGAKLNVLLGRDPSAAIPRPAPLPDAELSYTGDELTALLRDHNPELESARLETRRTELSLALARKERKPDIMLGVGIGDGAGSLGGSMSGANTTIMGMISLNLPVNGAKYRAIASEAAANDRAARSGRLNRELELTAELESTLFAWRDAGRKTTLYRDTLLPGARQAYEVSLRSYEGGGDGFLDLMDSLNTMLELELALERARADRVSAAARISELAGTDIPDRHAP